MFGDPNNELPGPPLQASDLGLNPAPYDLCFTSASSKAHVNGDRSSMVELQFVVLAVAGSSPVDRPFFSKWEAYALGAVIYFWLPWC